MSSVTMITEIELKLWLEKERKYISCTSTSLDLTACLPLKNKKKNITMDAIIKFDLILPMYDCIIVFEHKISNSANLEVYGNV